MPDHLLAFVTGLHRSGTTLLASSLARHPDVSGLTGTGVKEDEGQHLQDVVPPARAYGGAGRFALDPRAHLTESSPLATPQNAERIFGQWAPYWDLGRPVLVEKSPPTIVRTRFFQALFPGARFVVSVRHPVVAVLSTRKWRRGVGLAALVEHWLAAHETLLADLTHLRAAHVVKYEHLVADPAGTLGGVGAFLGLSAPVPADAVRADRSDAYVEAWRRLARSRLPWRRAQHRSLLAAYEDRVRRFGYSLADLAVAEPFPAGGRG
ncbi:MAG TPA: sulfotransferase [Streptosporangiales bacterium]